MRKTFTHYIDKDNLRLTPDSNRVNVSCTVEDGVCTVTCIHLTCYLVPCIKSFTQLAKDVADEADALFLEPIPEVVSKMECAY